MLGTLVAVGVGALAFKLGMDSQKMHQKGKSTAEIVSSLPGDAVDTVASAAMACYSPIANLIKGKKSTNAKPDSNGADNTNNTCSNNTASEGEVK